MLLPYIESIVNLVYPPLCKACENELPTVEKWICLDCYLNLPLTKFKNFRFNLATERLEGRFPLIMGYTLLHFEKHSMVQKLIHGLKYKGERHTGHLLGQLLGREFVQNHEFKNIDMLVPIPLHTKKQMQRGYNQSECLIDI